MLNVHIYQYCSKRTNHINAGKPKNYSNNSADGNGIDKQISSKHFLFENKLHKNFRFALLDLQFP